MRAIGAYITCAVEFSQFHQPYSICYLHRLGGWFLLYMLYIRFGGDSCFTCTYTSLARARRNTHTHTSMHRIWCAAALSLSNVQVCIPATIAWCVKRLDGTRWQSWDVPTTRPIFKRPLQVHNPSTWLDSIDRVGCNHSSLHAKTCLALTLEERYTSHASNNNGHAGKTPHAWIQIKN